MSNIQSQISTDFVEDLLNRITKGPWHVGKHGGVYHVSDYDDQTFGMDIIIAEVFEDADAEAIARVPELLAEILRLHKTIHGATKLGYIVGFLGEDEARINAFREECGDDLLDSTRVVLSDNNKYECTAEWRKGKHEEYLRSNGSTYCRACGLEISGPK